MIVRSHRARARSDRVGPAPNRTRTAAPRESRPASSPARDSRARPVPPGSTRTACSVRRIFGQSSTATSTPTDLERSKLACSGNASGMPDAAGQVLHHRRCRPTFRRGAPPAEIRGRQLRGPRSAGSVDAMTVPAALATHNSCATSVLRFASCRNCRMRPSASPVTVSSRMNPSCDQTARFC